MARSNQRSNGAIIAVAIIGAVSTLGAAIIGFLPHLMKKDDPNKTADPPAKVAGKDSPPPIVRTGTAKGGQLGGTSPLPDFLQVNEHILMEKDGIRFNGRKYLLTKTGDHLERDFAFSVVYAHKAQGDAIAFVGIGAVEKGIYDEPDRSVFLRIHPPNLDNGKIGLTKIVSSNQITFGFIPREGTHRVTIEKKGNAITYAIDVDNDGPSPDDLEQTIADLKVFAPFLTNKNCYLFIGGGALFKEVALRR